MYHMTKLILLQILILILTLTRAKSQTIGTDCNGKSFLCVEPDRYQVCIDLPSGRSETIDNVAYPCASGTYCTSDSLFECDSLVKPTTSTMAATSDTESSTLPTILEVSSFDPETTSNVEMLSIKPREESSETPPSKVSQNSEPSTSADFDIVISSEDTWTSGTATSSVNLPSTSQEESSEAPFSTVSQNPDPSTSAESDIVTSSEDTWTSGTVTSSVNLPSTSQEESSESPFSTVSQNPDPSTSAESDIVTSSEDTSTARPATSSVNLPSTSQEESSETTFSAVSQNPESSTSAESDFVTSSEDTSDTSPSTTVDTISNTDVTQTSNDLQDTLTSDAPLASSSTLFVGSSEATFQSSNSTSEEIGSELSNENELPGTVPEILESTSELDLSTSETTSISSTTESSTTSPTELETSSTTVKTTEPSSTSTAFTTEQTSTTKAPFVCRAPRRYPHETDCHKYYVCLQLPGGLLKMEMNCFYNMAYDPLMQRCVIDQSTCPSEQPFVCSAVGKFPDPSDPSRYFWCLKIGPDYNLYTMTCPSGQLFYPAVEQCGYSAVATGSTGSNSSDDSDDSDDSEDSSSLSSQSSESSED